MKYYPTYREPYRNQFHFSPVFGWMNDINGAWYQDGLYHMTFQYNPNALGQCHHLMFIGHAVSPDLLHWTQWPNAVSPGLQFKGATWSGTAVIDTNNRAGFGKDAIVMMLTDHIRGQCLVYSTDGGVTFQEYDKNPVIRLDDAMLASQPDMQMWDQRDPKLIWLEKAQRFIAVVYFDKDPESPDRQIAGGSMEFYESKDLKHWHLSQIYRECNVIEDLQAEGVDTSYIQSGRYLYECPNLFELTVDGENKSYWILHAASSHYVIGRFDGTQFRAVAYPQEQLSNGPDFYAGQVFVGIDRTIDTHWLGHWLGTNVEPFPFRCAATFPCEMKLVRLPEGLRIIRNPIDEIRTLYSKSVTAAPTCAAHITPDGFIAPFFDMTLSWDWAKTDAEEVELHLADKVICFSKKDRTLTSTYHHHGRGDGKTILSFGNADIIRVRALVDRDVIELFINDGRYCYTEEYGFDAPQIVVSLSGDGDIAFTGGEFHPLNCIW